MIHPDDIRNKRIGFSVLNWGLGHVTRCIPLIVRLQQQSNELIIFCDEDQQSIFSQYIEGALYVRHKGYPFNFRGKGRFKSDLMNYSPLFQISAMVFIQQNFHLCL